MNLIEKSKGKNMRKSKSLGVPNQANRYDRPSTLSRASTRSRIPLTEQQENFRLIYKLLNVKSIKQLRFKKKPLQEMRVKFNKLSRLGLRQENEKKVKNEVVINPNHKLQCDSCSSSEDECPHR